MKCPQCGEEFSGNFCSNCGLHRNESQNICPRCGAKYVGKFCSNCGYSPVSHPGVSPRPQQSKFQKVAQRVCIIIVVVCLIGLIPCVILMLSESNKPNVPAAAGVQPSNSVVTPAPTPAASTPIDAVEPPEDADLVCYLEFYNNTDPYKDSFVKFACRIDSVLADSITVTEGLDGGRVIISPLDNSKLEYLQKDNCITVIGRVDYTLLGICSVSDAVIVDVSASSLQLYGEQKDAYNSAKLQRYEAAKEEYISKCTKGYASYSDLIRNPESQQDEYVQLTVDLEQKLDGGLFDSHTYYRCYYGGDELILCDTREIQAPKLIVDDTVVVYGRFDGTLEMTRALTGEKIEVPLVNGDYIELAN